MKGINTVLEKIFSTAAQANIENDKVQAGNRAAKVRLRKHLQEIKDLAQEGRVELLKQKPE